MLAVYRELAALRRREPALTDPAFAHVRAEVDDQQRWVRLGRGDLEIVLNLAEEERTIPVGGDAQCVWETDAAATKLRGDSVTLGGRSAVVLRVTPAPNPSE